jgi:DNA-binding MarR family transcriptional regulator
MTATFETPQTVAQQMAQDCIAKRLRQVNRMVTRLYDDALRPLGLTVNQLNILATIVSQRQLQPGQLGRVLGMEKSTVSRTIERMAKKGWIEIGPGQNGRTQLLKATTTGRQLLLKASPIWDTLQTNILGTMESGGLGLLGALGLSATDADAFASDDEDDFYVSADDFYQ